MSLEAPYPVYIASHVIGGFGRGSSELGIPTANIPSEDLLASAIPHGKTGIYFGFCKISGTYGTLTRRDTPADDGETKRPPENEITSLEAPIGEEDGGVLPMVMSLGWNPFYGNSEPSAEVHVVHKFSQQFYGARIKLAVLGYIRPESNFVSVEALIDEIMHDIQVAKDKLAQPEIKKVAEEEFWKD
ncbi:riboflavin kinase-domain-containing protein [Kockiozyma suomiensis]|uniref:riboflavin kinase-domain-containing protein n=1 Tax=Kockiozyma suomiensis TaxID=1337062 RepID=UPI00334337F2